MLIVYGFLPEINVFVFVFQNLTSDMVASYTITATFNRRDMFGVHTQV